jgi:hypothetical protein
MTAFGYSGQARLRAFETVSIYSSARIVEAPGEPAMTPEFTSNLSMQSKSRSLRPCLVAAVASALLLSCAIGTAALAQTPTLIVMRAMPAKAKKGDTFKPLPALVQTDIGEIKIGGKPAPITTVTPLLKGPTGLQLMVLLDSMQMIGDKGQFDDIKKFFNQMPPNVEIGVGYMLQGNVKIAQTFTSDRTLAGNALVLKTREEAANPKNDNGNPFQCLRQLSAHWPNGDPAKLRALLMFTDGIIRGNGQSQGGDQLNPDVDGASQSLQRTGIIPYPYFYMDFPKVDPNRNEGGQLEGQSNFSQLAADTGGEALWEGQFSPSSLFPLLDKLYSVLQGSVVVTVTAPGAPGKYQRLDVKATKDDIKILAPDNIMIGNTIKK